MAKYVQAIESIPKLITEGKIYPVESERFIREDTKIKHLYKIIDDSGCSREYGSTYFKHGDLLVERLAAQKERAVIASDNELAILLNDAIERLKGS